MAIRKKGPAAGSNADSDVDEYMASLEHPYKRGVQALREAILGVDSRIQEEVKWNAPSFRAEDHFATFRLHPAPIFQLILHTGAKSKASPRQFCVSDKSGLVTWAAKNRCFLVFQSDEDALARRDTVIGIVREWIAQL